ETDMKGRESHHDREGAEHDHDDFDSFVMPIAEAASLDELKGRVEMALRATGVLRIKGRAAVAGKTAAAVIQAVGPRVEASFAPGEAATGLVVIGLKDMDRAAVIRAL